MMDTVFDQQMRPVFVNEPSEVLRRLKARYPDSWTHVCVGETGTIVDIPEYLYQEKYTDVQKLIKDVLVKKDLAMYKRDPSRLETYIQKTSRKIIEIVLKENR